MKLQNSYSGGIHVGTKPVQIPMLHVNDFFFKLKNHTHTHTQKKE